MIVQLGVVSPEHPPHVLHRVAEMVYLLGKWVVLSLYAHGIAN